MKPVICKLGTIDFDLVETTPVVFRNRLYRFEYVRNRYKPNTTGDSYFRFVDVESGKYMPSFAASFHLGSAFVQDDVAHVFAVPSWGGDTIYHFQSADLAGWSKPEAALQESGAQFYNTSVCHGRDGFVLSYERGEPVTPSHSRFALSLAESADLRHWQPRTDLQPPVPLGCPTLRYSRGYYYLISGEGTYETGIRQFISRSADLKKWAPSPYIVMDFSDEDRRIHGDFTSEQCSAIAHAVNINNSDLDLCEYQNKVIMYYSWGNQRGIEFLATASADGNLDDFLSSWFPASE